MVLAYPPIHEKESRRKYGALFVRFSGMDKHEQMF